MRLVIDARESGTTTGRYVDKLLEYLHKQRPSFEVVVLAKHPRIEFVKSIGPSFSVVESNYEEFSFGEQLGLARQLYSLKADLVHFSMTQQPILYYGKSITTVHDLTTIRFRNPAKNWLMYKLKQWIYRGVIFWVAHKSKKILTPSDFVKKDLMRFAGISPKKVLVTYEAADKIAGPAQELTKLKNQDFIMYVGRPTPHKNLGRLVEAFAILTRDRPALKLVLVGKDDANYARLKTRVDKAGLSTNVIFTGFVPDEQLKWLYENTRVYVFPSLSEGFGLPGLEAMAHGAPLAASQATCLPEVYGPAAQYFDPMDSGDIAAKVAQVLDDSGLRAKLVKTGLVQAQRYSWAKTAGQTLDVYQQFLDK